MKYYFINEFMKKVGCEDASLINDMEEKGFLTCENLTAAGSRLYGREQVKNFRFVYDAYCQYCNQLAKDRKNITAVKEKEISTENVEELAGVVEAETDIMPKIVDDLQTAKEENLSDKNKAEPAIIMENNIVEEPVQEPDAVHELKKVKQNKKKKPENNISVADTDKEKAPVPIIGIVKNKKDAINDKIKQVKGSILSQAGEDAENTLKSKYEVENDDIKQVHISEDTMPKEQETVSVEIMPINAVMEEENKECPKAGNEDEIKNVERPMQKPLYKEKLRNKGPIIKKLHRDKSLKIESHKEELCVKEVSYKKPALEINQQEQETAIPIKKAVLKYQEPEKPIPEEIGGQEDTLSAIEKIIFKNQMALKKEEAGAEQPKAEIEAEPAQEDGHENNEVKGSKRMLKIY